MTFVLALANSDQVIQVSDRRISYRGRDPDTANKAGHALCDDASFLYSFTGIAKYRNFETSKWLLDILYDTAQKARHEFKEIAYVLAEEATEFFRKSPELRQLPATDRRLTIMLTGYTASDLIVNALISNFQDFTKFVDHPGALHEFTTHLEVSSKPASENPTMIQIIGQYPAFTDADGTELRLMLERRAPAEAIRQKAIIVVQSISQRAAAHGTVSGQVNTALIAHSDPFFPFAGYASDAVENTMHLVDQVNLRRGAPKVVISDIQITADSPVVFPRVHRNAPCPCGSGKQYRHCHRN